MMDPSKCSVWKGKEKEGTPEAEAEWLERRKTLLTASDVASALELSPFKNIAVLWMEKTGYMEPADLSNNPAVIYGKQNEKRIRDEWAEENKDWCEVEYHATDIYISNRRPYLGATLDGEIHTTAAGKYGTYAGEIGVLEIKTSGFMSARELALWDICPMNYVIQVYYQMIVTGATFAVLRAEVVYRGSEEFQRDLPDKVYREFFFRRDPDMEMKMLKETDTFWRCVQNKEVPIVTLENDREALDIVDAERALTEVKLDADVEIGVFTDNFDAIKDGVIELVEPYKGLVLTANQVKDAKKIKADLNKMATAISDKRKAVKEKYTAPLKAFEARANELVSTIKAVIDPIDAQIKYFEDEEKKAKAELCTSILEDARHAILGEDCFLNTLFAKLDRNLYWKDTWLNKSTSKKSIEKDIQDFVEVFSASIQTILTHCGNDEALQEKMVSAYMATGNLGDAMMAEEKYKEFQRLNEERKAREEAERSKVDPNDYGPFGNPSSEKTQPQVQEVKKAAEGITYRFEATHTSVEAWKGLLNYMIENGFKYTKLN